MNRQRMSRTGKCRILAVANSKGGVGKSTLAANLAVEAAAAGLKVMLVDTDPQASCTQFAATRPEDRPAFRVVQMTKPIVHREIPALAETYDLAILDTGGRDGKTFRSALAASQTILIPIAPSAYDIWASEDVFTVVDELASTRDDLRALVVLNLVIPRTRIAREALEAFDEILDGQDVTLLETRIHSRVAWKMASSYGLAVTEFESRGRAAEELRALVAELRILPEGDSP